MVTKEFNLNKEAKEKVVDFIFSQLKGGEPQIQIAIQDNEEWVTLQTYKTEDGIMCEICRENSVVVDELVAEDVEKLTKNDVHWFVRKV